MEKELTEICADLAELRSCLVIFQTAADNEFEVIKNIDASNYLDMALTKIDKMAFDLNRYVEEFEVKQVKNEQ